MSIADRDRLAVRRASFRRALGKGDLLGIARAWDRLRVPGTTVTPEEAEAARAARLALGHAIRDARWRRHHDDRFGIPITSPAATTTARSLVRLPARALAALAVIGLVASLGALLLRPGALVPSAPALAPLATALPGEIAAAGRGRTSATLPPVASALPKASVAPVALPTAAATPSGSPGALLSVAQVGALLPPARQSGYDRFVFRVVDSSTLQPLSGVCVIYGTTDCGPNRPHTNALGLWWIDFPQSDLLAPVWDFRFAIDGYTLGRVEVTYIPGAAGLPTEVRMQRRGS